jgi:GT2 family glycosyltransferase
MKKSPKPELKVSIVLPNWNGVYLMKKHLKQVMQAAPHAQIVVADDASSDGSVEFLHTNFPGVVVVANSARVGFAGNVNSGVARATGDIVILLNTDVEPEKGFLEPLISHFADPEVFAVGALEKSPEKEGIVLRGRGVARWHKGSYIHSRGEIDKDSTAWVSGGSGAFRKSMWDILGGMDTLYNPFYWEDIDLSYRARKNGWKTLFEAKSIVHHYHEEGKIKREFTPADVKRIAFRNQFIFTWKNVTDGEVLLSHFLWTPVRIVQSFLAGDMLMFQGYLLAIGKLFSVVNHRYAQMSLYRKRDQELTITG